MKCPRCNGPTYETLLRGRECVDACAKDPEKVAAQISAQMKDAIDRRRRTIEPRTCVFIRSDGSSFRAVVMLPYAPTQSVKIDGFLVTFERDIGGAIYREISTDAVW